MIYLFALFLFFVHSLVFVHITSVTMLIMFIIVKVSAVKSILYIETFEFRSFYKSETVTLRQSLKSVVNNTLLLLYYFLGLLCFLDPFNYHKSLPVLLWNHFFLIIRFLITFCTRRGCWYFSVLTIKCKSLYFVYFN